MDSVFKQIETVIRKSLVPFLAEKADIDVLLLDEYVSEWLCAPVSKPVKQAKAVKAPKPDKVDCENKGDVKLDDCGDLKSKTIAELKVLAKAAGVKTAGLKAELIERIQAAGSSGGPPATTQKETKKAPAKKPVRKDFISDSEESDCDRPESPVAGKKRPATKTNVPPPKVVDKVERDVIETETDKYGNVYNPKTGFVFNKDDEVMGKKEGKNVIPLDRADIELCKEMQLVYVVQYDINDPESDVE